MRQAVPDRSRPARVLVGDVVVISPHLDDAAFSLGAAVARATRTGASVRVLTVFAGDPDSERPAAWWDRKAGFTTEGEAARARRMEDREACSLLGATPVWLPFSDATYERQIDADVLVQAIAAAVDGADLVLVPGFPLLHVDHRLVARELLTRRPPGARLGLYVEQPYAKWQGRRRWSHRPSVSPEIASLVPHGLAWTTLAAERADRRSKYRAMAVYRSQLPLFSRGSVLTGRLFLRRVALYEALRGGEAVAWLD
jgi:LmbE family N-acetylglucosaminyl deacetylase